jgi:hypothetical protein
VNQIQKRSRSSWSFTTKSSLNRVLCNVTNIRGDHAGASRPSWPPQATSLSARVGDRTPPQFGRPPLRASGKSTLHLDCAERTGPTHRPQLTQPSSPNTVIRLSALDGRSVCVSQGSFSSSATALGGAHPCIEKPSCARGSRHPRKPQCPT